MINPNDFARWDEVVEYADEEGITLAEAIDQLVNSGLSHRW